MAISLTPTTAKGACLAGPGGIDIESLETVTLSFVLDQSVQLVKCPSVKTAPHFFVCPNPLTNIRQVFQHNRSCLGAYGLLNNLFAHLVIDMLDAACLFARDFLQQLSRRLRTVGLQAAPLGQKRIACVANPSSSKKFSATRRSEDVLPKVYTRHSLEGNLLWIREIKDKIEIPVSLPEAVADGEKFVSQLRQENSLLSGDQKLYTDSSLSWWRDLYRNRFYSQY